MLTLEQAQAILASPPQNDTIVGLLVIAALEISALDEIDAAETNGTLDTETADEAISDTLTSALKDRADILGVEFEELQEEVDEVAQGSTVVDSFGQGLIALIVHHADSIEEGVQHVAANTGIDRDTLVDYMNDNACPSNDEAMTIASCFDDPTAQLLIELAARPPSEQSEGMEMANYSNPALEAEFSALVERTAAKDRIEGIANRLRNAERAADRMVADNLITPAERRDLLGEAIDPEDRPNFAAYFSAAHEQNGSNAERELDRIEGILGFFKTRTPVNNYLFADFSMEPLIDIDADSQSAVTNYRKKHGYS